MKHIILIFAIIFSLSACKQNTGSGNTSGTDTGNNPTNTSTGNTEGSSQSPQVGNTAGNDGYYTQLQGRIGNSEIQMNLVKSGKKLYGNYTYTKIGELLDLNAPDNKDNIDEQGNFTLSEFATTKKGDYDQTGVLKGQVLPDGGISGTWSSPDGKKVLELNGNTIPMNGSAILGMVNVEKQEGNCQTEEPCAHIEIIYPIVNKVPTGNTAASNNINNTIATALASSMPTEAPTPPESAVLQFIKDFKEQDASFKMSWEHEVKTNIYHNANYVLSLGFATYSFTGGAHPNHAESYYNFNLTNGKEIELSDIFQSDYEKELTRRAEQKLRKIYNIPAKAPLSESGFFEDKFELNDNFSISKTGITFLYNPYEIAPYVMGEQQIYFSFPEVKDLLKSGGVVSW